MAASASRADAQGTCLQHPPLAAASFRLIFATEHDVIIKPVLRRIEDSLGSAPLLRTSTYGDAAVLLGAVSHVINGVEDHHILIPMNG
jgi:hypothetical protein